jgi:hypothetical protein
MERDRGGSTECGARLIFTESAQVDEPVRRHVRKSRQPFQQRNVKCRDEAPAARRGFSLSDEGNELASREFLKGRADPNIKRNPHGLLQQRH